MPNRRLIDTRKQVVKACPGANANHNSSTIDLEQVVATGLENVMLEIVVPATLALVDAKKLTITVQDSANDSSYAAVAGLATLVITGKTGNGSDAATRVVALPPSVRRYVQLNIAVENGGGDITGTSVTASLLF
jgi:hypothetical protein